MCSELTNNFLKDIVAVRLLDGNAHLRLRLIGQSDKI